MNNDDCLTLAEIMVLIGTMCKKAICLKIQKKTSKRKTLKSFKIPKPTKNIHSYDMMLI